MVKGKKSQGAATTTDTDRCEHPDHQEYLDAFLRKYPSAKRDAHYTILNADPEEWGNLVRRSKELRTGCVEAQFLLIGLKHSVWVFITPTVVAACTVTACYFVLEFSLLEFVLQLLVIES